MEPIDPKVKEVWRRSMRERQVWPKTYEHVDIIADAFVHERAMRAKAEFAVIHRTYHKTEKDWCVGCFFYLQDDEADNRHNWTDADWEAQIRAELESEK